MASRTLSLVAPSMRQFSARSIPRATARHLLFRPQPWRASTIRAAHSIPRPPPITPRENRTASTSNENAPKSEGERPEVPSKKPYYQLSFTCAPCGHRSHHNVTKQAYHTGSTLITCPECRNRHIISDHLGIFTDRKGITVEDILREKGQLIKRGSIGEDGDIEFWPDESEDAAKSPGSQ